MNAHTAQGQPASVTGPTPAKIRSVLKAAGHPAARAGRGKLAIPSVGFTVRKGSDDSHVIVGATMHGSLRRYVSTLEASGYRVEPIEGRNAVRVYG